MPEGQLSNNQEQNQTKQSGFNVKGFLIAFLIVGAILGPIIVSLTVGQGLVLFLKHGLKGIYGGQPIGYVYVPDQYFRDSNSTTIENILSVMNSQFHLSADYYQPYVQKIFQKAQEKQLNPGIIISVWGKEQGFKNPNKAFGYGSFNGSDAGFDNQLEGTANSMVKAANNEDPYHYDDTSKPIFVRWIDRYTPLSDPRNSQDRINFAKYLKAFIPNQIVEEQAPGGGGGGWSWPLGPNKPLNNPRSWAGHACFLVDNWSKCSDYGQSNMAEAGAKNAPIFAIGDGTITFQSGKGYGYGGDPYMYWSNSGGYKAGYNALFTSSDGKVKAFYAHIFRDNVAGQPTFQVKGNEQFAKVYDSVSPHLHFQLMINNNWVDYYNQPMEIRKLIATNQQISGTALPLLQGVGNATGATLHGKSINRPEPSGNGHDIINYQGRGDAVDIFAPKFTSVYAPFAGTYSKPEMLGSKGFYIKITGNSNGKKLEAVLAHLDTDKMIQYLNGNGGTIVKAGQQIGVLEDNLNDEHLHFELAIDGQPVVGNASEKNTPSLYHQHLWEKMKSLLSQ